MILAFNAIRAACTSKRISEFYCELIVPHFFLYDNHVFLHFHIAIVLNVKNSFNSDGSLQYMSPSSFIRDVMESASPRVKPRRPYHAVWDVINA